MENLGVYTLDAAPSIVCYGEGASTSYRLLAACGAVGWLCYCIIVPIWLLTHLKRDRDRDVEASKAGISSPAVIESYGWVLLKYKPARWFFEIPLLWHKVFTISAGMALDSGAHAATGLLLKLLIGTTVVM